jgi:hypothetical protein
MIREIDNYDDIKAVYAAAAAQRDALARVQVATLSVGDEVSFSARSGRIFGQVKKVNRKTILVQGRNTSTVWKVPAAMLTKVEMA